MKMTGMNTAASVTEVDSTANRISAEPFSAASLGDIPRSTFL